MLEVLVTNNSVVENDSINAILCTKISVELEVIHSKEDSVERKYGNNLATKYVGNIKIHIDQQITDNRHCMDKKLKEIRYNNHYKENKYNCR